MKLNKSIFRNLLITTALMLTAGTTLTAHADRNDTYYFDRHDRAYTQPQQKLRDNQNRLRQFHHSHKHHRIYNQNRGYYKHLQREYFRHQHPKTRYNYGLNYSHNDYSTLFEASLLKLC